jgi:RNA polymerase sigma factor (sigma-70 family)
LSLGAGDVDLDRDRVLVERFQAGDRTAFDELYQRYHDRLVRFCLKRVKRRDTAEEIAQEAFTRALGAMANFRGERRFYPWVTVIASRLCIDHYRRLARVHTVGIPDTGVHDDDEAILSAVDSQLVTKAMERLRLRHQDVLRMREIEGWSYQRIADEFGVNSRTIDALLFRARKALRREYEAVGGGLVAVPLLGGLARGMIRLRSRVEPYVHLGPGAAAAAVTVTAATVGLVMAPQSPITSRAPVSTPTSTAKTAPADPTAVLRSPQSPAGAAPTSPDPTVATGSTPAGATTSASSPTGPGLPVPGLLGAGGVLAPPVQSLLPTLVTPTLPTVPTVPPVPGSVSKTVTSVAEQLNGH